MNDQAKKLRELAQKIREERDRANLILDPTSRRPDVESLGASLIPKIEEINAPRKRTVESKTPSFASLFPTPSVSRMPLSEQALDAPAIAEPAIAEPDVPEPKEAAPQRSDAAHGGSPTGAQPAPRPAPAQPPATTPADAHLPSGAASAMPTRLIAVSSGKGGVGKSNLCANLGIALAMRGKKVVLFDADLGLANIDVIFGINPKYNLKHMVDGEKSLREIVVEGPHSLKIVPGGSGTPELANLGDEQQQKLLENFAQLERDADITLIDTGAGISKDIISFILAAREAIIITTPEPTAITDAYGLIKVLTQRDMDVDIKIVVNMVASEQEGRDIADRIVLATRQFLNKRIDVLGHIVSDPAVNVSIRKQQPFILGYPTSRASKCVKQLAATLDRVNDSEILADGRNGFRGFLSRLFER